MDFVNSIQKATDEYFMDERENIIAYLEDNNWFEEKPRYMDGKVYITEEQAELYKGHLLNFLSDNVHEPQINTLKNAFAKKFPLTAEKLDAFIMECHITDESHFYIMDFLLYNLEKDIFLMGDVEISDLMEKAVNELIKAHGDILTFFLSWLKEHVKTAYRDDYILKNRVSYEENNMAYDFDEFLELDYYLFNEDYIQFNDMYTKAAQSKNYADTWLFLAMHFICSLRTTDLARIHHPIIEKEPRQLLNEIIEGTYTEDEARHALQTITWRLCVLPLTPNKTHSHSNISSLKFDVPESVEAHMGMLLSICEAHHRITGLSSEEPLIRRITDYERISKYMGDEIGALFLRSNFRSRSANKSYLQMVFTLADDILGEDVDGPSVKGYILASLARSHKGSYNEFATTTATYLKDAKLNGLTPELVAMELFERGILSFIPSMLLKIITGGEYNKLSVHKQTELIKVLDMTPAEIERTVAQTEIAKRKATEVVNKIASQSYSKDELLDALHLIGTGKAFSKQPECMCLLTSLKKMCPYNERRQCIGCQYEISTKSTMFLLASEYNRLMVLYEKSEHQHEKKKYQSIITKAVLPAVDEILACTREQYGQEAFERLEKMLQENLI